MPGLGEFGEREPAHAPKSGKRTAPGRPLSPSRLHRAKTRDTLLEEELKQISDALKGRDQYICIDTLREAKKPEGRARRMNRPLDSHIFGEAIQEKPRSQRIRPDFSAEELAVLQHPDNRKDDAAEALASGGDMLQKMASDNYPMVRPADPHKRRKKSFQPSSYEAVDTEAQPDGFRGLGAKCPAEHKRGVAPKPREPFVPEFKAVARHGGRGIRTNTRPKDAGIFAEPPTEFEI